MQVAIVVISHQMPPNSPCSHCLALSPSHRWGRQPQGRTLVVPHVPGSTLGFPFPGGHTTF